MSAEDKAKMEANNAAHRARIAREQAHHAARCTTHKLVFDGPVSALASPEQHWRCSCGAWEADLPGAGDWGHYTLKARTLRLNRMHHAHVTKALRAGVPIGEATIPNDATPQQIVNAVEPMLKAMAAKAWAMHPNNPKNKKGDAR